MSGCLGDFQNELTIGYSVLAERAKNLRPPDLPGAEVLVCVQGGEADWNRSTDEPGTGALPRGARMIAVPGIGVARSRNVVLALAARRYVLFCDDDVTVDVSGVLTGVGYLRSTGAALALGRALCPDGRLRKRYPQGIRPLRVHSCGRAATYEILVDADQVRARGIWFDERFGAGTRLALGDEFIFIAGLLRAGLRAYAVPYVFGVHPEVSSGTRWEGPDSTARAAAINQVFGRLALPARTGFALRHRSLLGGWRAVARFVGDGTRPESELAAVPQARLPGAPTTPGRSAAPQQQR